MTTENRVYDYNHAEPTEEDPLKDDFQLEEKEETRTFCSKVIYVLKHVTLEPCILLQIIANMINSTATNNLYLDKACRVNLNFSVAICDSLRAQDHLADNQYEADTQNLVANAQIWKTYISASMTSIIVIFAGAFSDTTGYRKVFIILSIAGQFVSAINSIFHVYFMYQLNLEAFLFSGATIEAITGGLFLCLMTVFTYISAITTLENRTFRIGVLSLFISVSFPIGAAVSGILLKTIDYYGCFGLASSLHFLNLLYLLIVVRDPKRNTEQKMHIDQGCCYLVRQFFSLASIKDSIAVIAKKAPNNRRLRLCLLLGVVSLLFGPNYGELAVLYLMTRYRFGWDEVQYGLFQGFNAAMQIIGMLLSVLLFSKYLEWHDSLLGVISIVSKILGAFVYCFAPNAMIFFIGPFIELLSGTSQLSVRSIISKLVAPDELGKVNSMSGIVENLMPLIYVALYTKVYTATMATLPGTVFLVSAGLALPAMAVLIWMFYDHRKQLSNLKRRNPD